MNIDELGFSLSVPSNMIVVTQKTDVADSVWEQLNVDPNEFISFLKDNSIYLDAVDPNGMFEIIVVDRTDEYSKQVFDLNTFEDADILEAMSDQKGSAVLDQGGTIISDEIYNSGKIKYYSFIATVPNNGEVAYSKAFYSIYNGKGFRIAICSYSGPISHQYELLIKAVIDSVHFNEEIPSVPDSSQKQSSSFLKTLGRNSLRGALVGLFTTSFAVVIAAIKKTAKKGTSDDEPSNIQRSGESLVVPPEENVLPRQEIIDIEKNETINSESETMPTNETEPQIIKPSRDIQFERKIARAKYCHRCGAKLLEESVFCSNCGIKIWTEDAE